MTGAVSTQTNFDDVMTRMGLSRGAATNTVSKKNDALDQSAFLRLMTTQLKNQDPFKPVENTEMVAQMAQMSQVSGIAEMNASLKKMSDRLGASEVSSAMSYVGRTVQVDGKVAYPNKDGGIDAEVALDRAATGVLVAISDSAGRPVRTMQLGAQDKGDVAIAWDGRDESGAPVEGGPFNIRVIAQRGDGATELTPRVWAPVTAVRLEAGAAPKLSVAGLGDLPLSAVRQVG